MFELIRAGGVPMVIVVLFGLLALGASGLFAWRPDGKKLGFIRSMTVATVFSVLAGTFAAFGAVMSKVPANPEWSKSPDLHLIVMTGLGESMSAGILGFTTLALVWMLTAIGIRRLDSVSV